MRVQRGPHPGLLDCIYIIYMYRIYVIRYSIYTVYSIFSIAWVGQRTHAQDTQRQTAPRRDSKSRPTDLPTARRRLNRRTNSSPCTANSPNHQGINLLRLSIRAARAYPFRPSFEDLSSSFAHETHTSPIIASGTPELAPLRPL